jgi:hypothetical protein
MQVLRGYAQEHTLQATDNQPDDSEDDLQRMQTSFKSADGTLRATKRPITNGAIYKHDTVRSSQHSASTLDAIEVEQQRLRESYSQAKQSRKSNSRSRSGYRSRKQNECSETMPAKYVSGFG